MAKVKNGVGGSVMQLGAADTKLWMDSGPRGHSFRSATREKAYALANKTGRKVEIYASSKSGGWMADEVFPER